MSEELKEPVEVADAAGNKGNEADTGLEDGSKGPVKSAS